MDAGTTITEVRGGEAERFVDGLVSLRIRVFRDFPYLYDGDMDYERRNPRTDFAAPRSFVVLGHAAGTLVGASTAPALAHEEAAAVLDEKLEESK